MTIAGDDNNETWKQIEETLLASFRWTPWETKTFKQCGVTVTQSEDFCEIVQDQEEYLQGLAEISIKPERAKQPGSPVTEHERSELRALLGGLQWLTAETVKAQEDT